MYCVIVRYPAALESSTVSAPLFTAETPEHIQNAVFVLYTMIQPQLTPLKEGRPINGVTGAELKQL